MMENTYKVVVWKRSIFLNSPNFQEFQQFFLIGQTYYNRLLIQRKFYRTSTLAQIMFLLIKMCPKLLINIHCTRIEHLILTPENPKTYPTPGTWNVVKGI